jgi:hypothetical protein
MDTNEPESDKVDRSLCFAKSRDCGRVRCVLALLSVGGCSQKRLAFLCRSCVISGNLGQGEAIMRNGGGSQTSASGRWGDYRMTTIDLADNVSFWHTNEYYATTGIIWSTKVGKFQFPA